MSIVIKTNFDNTNMPAGMRAKNAVCNNNFQNDASQSPIDAKRQSARKQALKLVTDAWASDNKANKIIQNKNDAKQARVREYIDITRKLDDIEVQKEKLREEYGIDADSAEQKDLELLEKYQDNKTGASYDSFSDEERARLKELAETPLTEYQKKMLELNGQKDMVDIEAQRKMGQIIALTESIYDSEREMDRNQDMLKAQDAADSLMEAANKDIMGMLVDEAKEHIDSVSEEAKEKAEKLEKEQEEREERIQATKEHREEMEERIQEARERSDEQESILNSQSEVNQLEIDTNLDVHTVDHLAEAQKEIEKLMKDNHMINEDLKGIEIDLNF